MVAFIRQAGPKFRAAGLKTKFLVADSANGSNLYDYALPILNTKDIAPYLGPISFHSWDALSATDLSYQKIQQLGQRFKKRVWCLEAGHDAQLWQQSNPWESWDNGLRTALAYAKTIRLSGATVMDYWTYQNNYPLVSADGKNPFRVFKVMQQLEEIFQRGATVVPVLSDSAELESIATVGPRRGQSHVLLVNRQGAGKVVLKRQRPGVTTKILTSDASGTRSSAVKASSKGELSVNVPTRSVVLISIG
jgi:hypothetical protein